MLQDGIALHIQSHWTTLATRLGVLLKLTRKEVRFLKLGTVSPVTTTDPEEGGHNVTVW